MTRTPALFIATLLASASVVAADAVEQYATTAASGANRSYQRGLPNDGVTQSARAYSVGKVLVHEYVLAIRTDASEKELSAWRASTRSEVIPSTCSLLKNDDFFQKRGFQIRYKYLNQFGKLLDDFQVNKPACSAYGL